MAKLNQEHDLGKIACETAGSSILPSGIPSGRWTVLIRFAGRKLGRIGDLRFVATVVLVLLEASV